MEIVEYSKTLAVLGDLRQRYEGVVYLVTTAKGMIDARKARAEIREWRTGLEKERIRIKAPALERARLIDSEAKRITAELVKLENPIDEQIKAEEDRKDKERLAKEETEKTRIENLRGRIQAISEIPFKERGRTSSEVTIVLESTRVIPIDETFQEFQFEAQMVKDGVVGELEKMFTEALAMEQEKVRIIAEREELAKLRAEQEERKREAEKKRVEDEAKVKAARELEERTIRQEREAEEKRMASERAKLEAERKAALDRITAEREVETKQIAAERKIHEDKMKAQAEEAVRKQREQEADQAEINRQRVAVEKQRKEQEVQAKLLSERRKKLAEARRDTPSKALIDILELAENIAEYPDHQAVRVQIALIAEASL
jgi:hypothetical protein